MFFSHQHNRRIFLVSGDGGAADRCERAVNNAYDISDIDIMSFFGEEITTENAALER